LKRGNNRKSMRMGTWKRDEEEKWVGMEEG
jgi:hypothetical protein